VETEAEDVALDEREEAVGTVLGPLEQHALAFARRLRLDERGALPQDTQSIAASLEEPPVGLPGRGQGLFGVVEQVEVSRQPRRRQQLVERRATRDVALAGSDPVVG
jgi:hypothetical protein